MLDKVIVDSEDIALLDKFNYRVIPSGKTHYVVRSEKIFTGKAGHRTRFLHRDILGSPPFKGAQVDHANGNGLDNRRCNLRWADAKQNHQNESKRVGCSSIFKGVSIDNCHGKWRANICCPETGKKISLGLFVTERDAAIAYDIAAKLIFKGFARTNNLITEERQHEV